jgi:hypothetical protein
MKKRKITSLATHNAEKKIHAFKTSKKSYLIQLLICGIIICILCNYGIIPFTYEEGRNERAYLNVLTLLVWLMPMVGIYSALEGVFFPARAKKFEGEFKKDFLEELKKK